MHIKIQMRSVHCESKFTEFSDSAWLCVWYIWQRNLFIPWKVHKNVIFFRFFHLFFIFFHHNIKMDWSLKRNSKLLLTAFVYSVFIRSYCLRVGLYTYEISFNMKTFKGYIWMFVMFYRSDGFSVMHIEHFWINTQLSFSYTFPNCSSFDSIIIFSGVFFFQLQTT